MTEIIYTHRTRTGRKARIIGNIKHDVFPIIAAILDEDSNYESCERFTKELKCLEEIDCEDDLFEYSPWHDVKVDTQILVSNSLLSYVNRHFAKYEDGYVYVWEDGRTSWSTPHMAVYKYAKLPTD